MVKILYHFQFPRSSSPSRVVASPASRVVVRRATRALEPTDRRLRCDAMRCDAEREFTTRNEHAVENGCTKRTKRRARSSRRSSARAAPRTHGAHSRPRRRGDFFECVSRHSVKKRSFFL